VTTSTTRRRKPDYTSKTMLMWYCSRNCSPNSLSSTRSLLQHGTTMIRNYALSSCLLLLDLRGSMNSPQNRCSQNTRSPVFHYHTEEISWQICKDRWILRRLLRGSVQWIKTGSERQNTTHGKARTKYRFGTDNRKRTDCHSNVSQRNILRQYGP
jgi:hypothetical protein